LLLLLLLLHALAIANQIGRVHAIFTCIA
jgi:hypothetical protein